MMTQMKKAIESARQAVHEFYKRLSWEDLAFIVLLALMLAVNAAILSQLKQLPSPLYGGDYYNHLGSIEHIYQGGSVFESGQMIGEIQWVPWLYHVMVVWFAVITGLSPMMANIWFSQVALILGSVIIYLFISKFFDSKLFGLIGVLWQGAHFPLYKYSPFSFYVVLPLLAFAAYNFMKKEDYRSAIMLGLAYGIAGLSNTYMFIQGTFFMAFLLAYYVLYRNVSFSKKFSLDREGLIKSLGKAATIFFLGFAIALLWWFKPIFVYHAHTVNDLQIYGFPVVSGLGGMIGLSMTGIKNEFFSYWSPATYFLGIGSLVGIALLFFLKKKKTEHILIIILLLSSLFGLFIHFITLPLLGTLLASGGLFNVGMVITGLLLSLFALDFIAKTSSRYNRHMGLVIIIIGALIFSLNLNISLKASQNEYWLNVTGKTPLSPLVVETRDWMLANTQLNDVFLSTNEDSFALNAISGRKIVTYRRTHASPYADMNQRMLDTGIMLYSTREDLRAELLRKYSVDYLYWQSGWLRNEFQFNPDTGQLQGFFDPLMIDYSPEREQALKDANVSYIRTTYYLDPAWLPSYPQRDVLVITPARADYTQPWSDTLDSHLSLVKEINQSGLPAVKIYRVTA